MKIDSGETVVFPCAFGFVLFGVKLERDEAVEDSLFNTVYVRVKSESTCFGGRTEKAGNQLNRECVLEQDNEASSSTHFALSFRCVLVIMAYTRYVDIIFKIIGSVGRGEVCGIPRTEPSSIVFESEQSPGRISARKVEASSN